MLNEYRHARAQQVGVEVALWQVDVVAGIRHFHLEGLRRPDAERRVERDAVAGEEPADEGLKLRLSGAPWLVM